METQGRDHNLSHSLTFFRTETTLKTAAAVAAALRHTQHLHAPCRLAPPPPQEIIGPLLEALPEQDKRKTLQAVYSKAQRAKDGQGEPEGVLGGLFGGWGSKLKPDATAAAAAPAPAKKGQKAAGAGKGKAAAAAATDPYAFAAGKLSDKDFKVFQTRTALYARGGINAR